MIEGITILNKIAITGIPSWMMISALIMIIIGIIVFVISIILDWPDWMAIFLFIGILTLAVVCPILNSVIKTGEYQYECIIDDSVPYNVVVDNYKIIEQRGDIWVLEDK